MGLSREVHSQNTRGRTTEAPLFSAAGGDGGASGRQKGLLWLSLGAA